MVEAKPLGEPIELDGVFDEVFTGLKIFSLKEVQGACKFFLKFRESPNRLVKEFPELEEEVRKVCDEDKFLKRFIPSKEYEIWLFRKAFEKALEEE